MSRVTITINTRETAFDGEKWGAECGRILRELAGELEHAGHEDNCPFAKILVDINDKSAGLFTVKGR